MPGAKYAFISAYLKGEELRVISLEHIDRISRVSNIQEVPAAIRDTDIGSYLEELQVKTFNDLDRYLWSYLAQRISEIESFKLVPKDILKVSKAYVVKYDVLNIKAALQSISKGKKAEMIPVGMICRSGYLDKLSQATSVDDIIEVLTQSKLEDYAPILQKYRGDGEIRSKPLIEAKLTNQCYQNMLSVAKGIKDGSALSKVLGLTIDLTNLQIVTRSIIEGMGPEAAEYTIIGGYTIGEGAIKDLLSLKLTEIPPKLEGSLYQDIAKEILSSYEATKSVTVVDEIVDKHKFRLAKEALSPIVLSPLVMAWYLILKEAEIRNLRLVVKAIYDGLPIEEIKRYLVL